MILPHSWAMEKIEYSFLGRRGKQTTQKTEMKAVTAVPMVTKRADRSMSFLTEDEMKVLITLAFLLDKGCEVNMDISG